MLKAEKNERFSRYKALYDDARNKYGGPLEGMDVRERYYLGTRSVRNANGEVTKREATNVRNIVFELIESQIDTTIPMPRVTPLHEEDKELAQDLESFLRAEAERLDFKTLNDLQERMTPIHGGDYAIVEWDTSAGTHCSIGDVAVTPLHPKQVIPQPGVTDIQKMEYIYILSAQTKESVRRRFGVDVESLAESDPNVRQSADERRQDSAIDGMVTVIDCYYRGDKGIGRISWSEDTLLRDEPDYQARKLEKCSKCGHIRQDGEKTCPVCGAHTWKKENEDGFLIDEDITVLGAHGKPEIIPAHQPNGFEYGTNPDGSMQFRTDEAGNPLTDENGEQMPVILGQKSIQTRLPYYKPNAFPILLRKNISCYGQLLGLSDVDVISDQQEAIKKFGSKIDEKILKGGSFLVRGEHTQVDTSGKELKSLVVRDAAEASLLKVMNVQPNIDKEQAQLEVNYSWAKSALGITDSFQGKYDASATSGTAKQFAAGQSSGRLQSKRVMKYEFYGALYQLMFKFLLAYADQPLPYSSTGKDGKTVFAHFDPLKFLKIDAAGTPYWDDEFLFSVDESATLSSNREALWSMAAQNFQSGAFGPLQDLHSAQILWSFYANTNYPCADAVLHDINTWLEQSQPAQTPEQPVTMNESDESDGTEADNGALSEMQDGDASQYPLFNSGR